MWLIIRCKRLQRWIGLLKETHKSRSWIFWIRMAFFRWGAWICIGFGNKILLIASIWSPVAYTKPQRTPFFFSEVSRNMSLKSYRHLRCFFNTDKIWIVMNKSAREVVVLWITIMCTALISGKSLTSTCHRGLKVIRQVLNLHATTLRKYICIYNCRPWHI